MNNYVIRRYTSHKKGQSFLNDRNAEYSAITLYPAVKSKYDSKLAEIDAALGVMDIDVHSITSTKDELKLIMGNLTLKYVNIGFLDADSNDKHELAKSLDVALYAITDLPDEEAKVKATYLKDLLKDNIADLEDITPADIVSIEKAISLFALKQTEPEEKISFKKVEGTGKVLQLLNELNEIRKKLGKLIQAYTPANYELWKNTTKVGKAMGSRKQSMVLLYKDLDTKVPLYKVKATITNGEETIVKYSSKKGRIVFYTLPSGNWKLISELPCYAKEENTKIGIDADHIERITIILRQTIISSL